MSEVRERQAVYKRVHYTVTAIGIITILALIIFEAQIPNWMYQTICLGFFFSISATWSLYIMHGGKTASPQSLLWATIIGLCMVFLLIFFVLPR